MPLASAPSRVNTTADVSDNAIETADIKDANVTLAKIASGTQGDILYAGASGLWAKLAAGASGLFLKSQGAGANPIWAATAPTFTSGVFTRDASTADGSVAVAHGLAAAPIGIRLVALCTPSDSTNPCHSQSQGLWLAAGPSYATAHLFSKGAAAPVGGTLTTKIARLATFTDGNTWTDATVTVDDTNMTFAWLKNGTPAGPVYYQWQAW